MILKDGKKQNPMRSILYPRYALKFPELSPYVEGIHGDCVSSRYSQRRRYFLKRVDHEFLREELNSILLVHLLENTLQNPNYPPQYPPQAPPPQQPSQQDLWAELQRLRAQQQEDRAKLAEAEKKERQSTYRVRRAKGSGNLSFNWGQDVRGAYLTPSKYQDGRVTIAGASMPAQIQLQNTQNGPYIVATIQNGPLNQEEVELYNEWFVKPVEVVPVRRGPRTGTGNQQGQGQAPPQQPQQQFQQPQFTPQAQPQYPAPAPYPQQPPAFAPQPQAQQQFAPAPQQYAPPPQAPVSDPMASIRHLDINLQNAIVAEAQVLLKTAPQAYPDLALAVAAVKRAKNIA